MKLSENTKNKHDKLLEELAGELEQYLQVNCFEDPLLEFRALIHFQLPVDALLSTHAKSDASSVGVPPYEYEGLFFLLSTQRPQDQRYRYLLLVIVTVSYGFVLQKCSLQMKNA